MFFFRLDKDESTFLESLCEALNVNVFGSLP